MFFASFKPFDYKELKKYAPRSIPCGIEIANTYFDESNCAMNVSLFTTDIASLNAAGPANSYLADGTNRTEGCRSGLRDRETPFKIETTPTNERDKEPRTELSRRSEELAGSYNIDGIQRERFNRNLENTGRHRLRENESAEKPAEKKTAAKTQESGAGNKTEKQPSVGDSAVSEKNKYSVADNREIANQTLKNASVQAVNKNTVSAELNSGQGIKSLLQKAQVFAGTGQNQTKTGQSPQSTTAQGTTLQQQAGQIQSAVKAESSAKTGNGQAEATSRDSSQNTAKTNLSARIADSQTKTQNSGEGVKQFGETTQQESVHSRTQLATLSAGTTTRNVDSQISEATAAAIRTMTNRDPGLRDGAKDKTDAKGQKDSRQSISERFANVSGIAQPAGKLNVEKIELFAGTKPTPKQEAGKQTQQVTQGQTTNSAIGEIITGNRPIATDRANSNASMTETRAAIQEQIHESIQASLQQGQRQITIQLNPPELGRVSIKFSERGNEMTGLLEATNPQTRAEIRQAIPEIIRSLEQSGITIKRIDVMLSDLSRQPGQQSWRDNFLQSQWEQADNHGFGDNGGNRPSDDSFITPTYAGKAFEFHQAESFESHQSSPSNELLDVLI